MEDPKLGFPLSPAIHLMKGLKRDIFGHCRGETVQPNERAMRTRPQALKCFVAAQRIASSDRILGSPQYSLTATANERYPAGLRSTRLKYREVKYKG